MAQAIVLDETFDKFNSEDGEITTSTRHKIIKRKVEVTDEFVKVSKYLNVIFAYNNIPLTLVPISLIFAQRMVFKTNELYLLKTDKEEIAQMLGITDRRVTQLIKDCKKYDIIRAIKGCRGKYEVNAFLFSTGDMVETRKLQAKFDFDRDCYISQAEQKFIVTGETVRKSVMYKKDKQLPGQMSFDDLITQKEE